MGYDSVFSPLGSEVSLSELGADALLRDSSHIILDMEAIHATPQGTWSFSLTTSARRHCQIVGSTGSASQNDEIHYKVYLAAGTYTLFVNFQSGTVYGIGTFYLDTTSLGTIDFYSGSTVEHNEDSITGITAATDGFYLLKVKMETKNGSATAYAAGLTFLSFVRTA